MEVIIKNGLVLQPDYSFKKQDIVIDNNEITGFNAVNGYEKINAKGKIVVPGFTNSHVHMAMGLARGLGEGMPLVRMFEEVLFPIEEQLTDEQAFLGAMVCGIEYLQNGCTHVNNINKTWSKPVLKAMNTLGLKGTMALALKDVDLKSKEYFDCEYLKENKELVKTLENHERINGLFGLANEVEASEELILEVKRLSEESCTGMHFHVAESTMEKEFIIQKTGKSSVEYLNDLGVLSKESIAVHAVNVSEEDINILSESGSVVVHCPTANKALGVGTAPIREMLDNGVMLEVGVDDPVATMNNDIFRELIEALQLQKERGFSLSDEELLSMAFGESKIGMGEKADLVLLDADHANLNKIVNGELPVDTVLVDGEIVMNEGKFSGFDREKILERASEESEELSSNFL